MGDDTVIECAVAMETLRSVNRSKNDGKTNSRTGGLDFTEISLADNVLMCSLSVPQTGNQVFDFNTKYTLLFATGQTKSEISTEKTKHSNLPVVSSEQADLTSNTQSLSSQPASNVLVKAHGSLMISAWVFAASFGLVIARYYKKLGGSRRWCGLHIWFQIHRIAMVLTFTLASIAFIIVFADVKGYSQVGKGANDLQFLQAHPILGIISTALVVINPLMALIRPKPDSATRPIFNWFHWAVGTTAWIISMVTIFIGFEIEKSGVPSYTKYVMAAFVAYQLLVELVLEIQGCIQKSDQKTVDGYEMKNMNGTSGVARHSTMKSGTNGAGVFRSVLLVAHFFILLGFLIALLALVNKQMLRSVYNSL
ncbi:putative ferric-chelate reductase 1 [Liolophura sinensis]|uniref:putative ferric-chelate reductase 1 n=1 Tax=Liolophura sinensis TaxID=3198878 RepID=UPI0031590A03